MPRREFGLKREEVKGELRKLHTWEFTDLLLTKYYLGDQIEKNTTGGILGRMGEETGVYRVFMGKPDGETTWKTQV